MLGKLDFTLFPTARHVIRVNNEIRTTELNLRDALLAPVRAENTIAELKRELEMLKAWIAPIRRLNADILSLVFEMCGEDDWKMPLRIAATSRDWRDLVLATPRAWGFLPAGECRDEQTINLFLQRSDPRPLHFYHPHLSGTSLLSSISQRLECLAIEDFHDDMGSLSFPDLKRLRIASQRDVQISRIDAARFPALRHLVCMDHFREVTPFIDGDPLNLPPLLSLSFSVIDSLWLSVLQACQDTLISLKLTVKGYLTMMHDVRLVFPRLLCLEIDYCVPSEWPLDLKTPVLETYIEHTYLNQSGILMHADVKTITQLRTDQVPESFTFPRVKLIQFLRKRDAELFLRHLLSNSAHCFELETIEVGTRGEPQRSMVELVEAVNRKLERAISLVFTRELSDLHGTIKTQLCGSNMPCHYDPDKWQKEIMSTVRTYLEAANVSNV